MSDYDLSYVLSGEELFFLSKMIGINRIAGIKDPYRGYLMDEIAEAYEELKVQMVQKKYLTLEEDTNEFIIDPMLGSCICTCGSNNVLKIEKAIPEQEQPYQACLYFTPHLVVELSFQDRQCKSFALSPVANTELTMKSIRRFFPLETASSGNVKFDLDGLNWEKWNGLSIEDQTHVLHKKGCSEIESEQITYTFHHADRKGSMWQLNNQNNSDKLESIHYVSLGDRIYFATDSVENRLSIEVYKPNKVNSFLSRFESQILMLRQ